MIPDWLAAAGRVDEHGQVVLDPCHVVLYTNHGHIDIDIVDSNGGGLLCTLRPGQITTSPPPRHGRGRTPRPRTHTNPDRRHP